jgi:hypothetical protein
MARGRVHTVYRRAQGDWTNEVEGGEREPSAHETKEEAIRQGRALAREAGSEHVIHNMDGTVSERNSYDDQPQPPRA